MPDKFDLEGLMQGQSVFACTVAGEPLSPAAVERLRSLAADVGFSARETVPGRACRVTVAHDGDTDGAALRSRFKAHAAELADAYALWRHAASPPEFRVCVMDMDSTLIDQEVIDEIAALAGIGEQIARITEETMQGKLDFEQSLRARVALLEGQPQSVLAEVLERRISATPGAAAMLAGMKARGIRTGVVSGGFTAVVRPFAERMGLDEAHANELEIANGRLTGRVLGDVVDARRKRTLLEEMCRARRCGPDQAIAIGDGANDLQMIGAAGLGVAFCAKPVVREQADAAVNVRRMDRVLLLLD